MLLGEAKSSVGSLSWTPGPCRRFHGTSFASACSNAFFEQMLLEQLFLERAAHSRLNLVAPGGQVVVAPSLVAGAETSEAVLA